jgi:dynein heavy chain 2
MLTPVTEKVALELLKGEVPLAWSAIWEGPSNPNSWLRLVTKKAFQLRSWSQRVNQKQPLNLSDLFHPETFLNALRQKSARL